jgi:hypothetical protein
VWTEPRLISAYDLANIEFIEHEIKSGQRELINWRRLCPALVAHVRQRR